MTDEAGLDDWVEETTAFDRVHSIATTVSEPQPVSYIADEAHVAENTARDHIERLVDMSILLKFDHGGTSKYAPDPLHLRAELLRELLDEHDHDGLIELKETLLTHLDNWEDEYGVEEPDDLRELASETDDIETIQNLRKTASEWEHVEYRLHVVDDAIKNYDTYTRDNIA